jgi:ethanolamine ammonia-lyase small subunit
VTNARARTLTSEASAHSVSQDTVHCSFRTEMVGENSIIFHNDSPVNGLCNHC